MALTRTSYFNSGTTTGGDITVSSISVAAGNLVTIEYVQENYSGNAFDTPTNTGTAITWTNIVSVQVSSNCNVGIWKGVASASETISVTVGTTAGFSQSGSCRVNVFTGQHATNPIPSGNVFSGSGTTDVNQSITSSSAGSMLAGCFGDWGATNSFAARTNCTITNSHNVGGAYTSCFISTSPEPLSGTPTIGFGETDTSGTIAWGAYEVQAAAGAPSGVTAAWLTA